jgi:hypothetical protein
MNKELLERYYEGVTISNGGRQEDSLPLHVPAFK